MTERIVCDASTVVAAILDSGDDGRWAAAQLTGADLFAPTLLTYECANVIRRLELAGSTSPDQAAQAHADLLDLHVDLWHYEVLAVRCWQLRTNLSSYDASYVALAEMLAMPLVTLDRRIQRAPGIRCEIISPDSD